MINESILKYLAQINIARFKDVNAPINQTFHEKIDLVNSMAESSKGFIWRYKGEDDYLIAYDPKIIVNMSVWETPKDLMYFVYKQMDHKAVFKKRDDWFEEIKPNFALWWVEKGNIPTLSEGLNALKMLELNGPNQEYFDFKYLSQFGVAG